MSDCNPAPSKSNSMSGISNPTESTPNTTEAIHECDSTSDEDVSGDSSDNEEDDPPPKKARILVGRGRPDPSTAFPSYPITEPYPKATTYPTYPHHPPFDVSPNTPFAVRPAVAYPPHYPPYTKFGMHATYKKGPECGQPPAYNEITGESPYHLTHHPPMSTYRPPAESAYWGPIIQPINLGAIYDPGARFNDSQLAGIPPPPPGIPPNAAQIAAMQGRPVIASQQPSSFLRGSDSKWK